MSIRRRETQAQVDVSQEGLTDSTPLSTSNSLTAPPLLRPSGHNCVGSSRQPRFLLPLPGRENKGQSREEEDHQPVTAEEMPGYRTCPLTAPQAEN